MVNAESAWRRVIAHADMDAFYAAVEQLDDPSLRGRPVLVGPPGNRGVVLTASYEARPFGVGSAMPMARARRMCPQALIVPPRFARYQAVSRTIMEVFGCFSPSVEALSLDEAFIDLTGCERLFGAPAVVGGKLQQAVRDATGGLTASVGVSATKFVAKVASGYRKPDALTVVPPEDARSWLAPLPVAKLWGAGPKLESRLRDLGLRTIGDVAAANPDWLAARLGGAGRHFHALAHAIDARAVVHRGNAKSIGSETTLAADVSDRQELKQHLRRSAAAIGRRLRKKHHVAWGVRVKLKTADFKILTRQHRMSAPTDLAQTLYAAGARLLDAIDHPGPFRLVGLTAFDLDSADDAAQALPFAGDGRQRRLEVAVDALAERYGIDVLRPAGDVGAAPRTTPNLDFLDDGN